MKKLSKIKKLKEGDYIVIQHAFTPTKENPLNLGLGKFAAAYLYRIEEQKKDRFTLSRILSFSKSTNSWRAWDKPVEVTIQFDELAGSHIFKAPHTLKIKAIIHAYWDAL